MQPLSIPYCLTNIFGRNFCLVPVLFFENNCEGFLLFKKDLLLLGAIVLTG